MVEANQQSTKEVVEAVRKVFPDDTVQESGKDEMHQFVTIDRSMVHGRELNELIDQFGNAFGINGNVDESTRLTIDL